MGQGVWKIPIVLDPFTTIARRSTIWAAAAPAPPWEAPPKQPSVMRQAERCGGSGRVSVICVVDCRVLWRLGGLRAESLYGQSWDADVAMLFHRRPYHPQSAQLNHSLASRPHTHMRNLSGCAPVVNDEFLARDALCCTVVVQCWHRTGRRPY